MKSNRTWIVIADGSRAKVLEVQGREFGISTVDDMSVAMDLPPNRDLQSDRPGRSFESANSSRHAVESRIDPHRELKRTVAKMTVDNLNHALKDGRFDRLILVAPPTMLGDLRDALTPPLLEKVTAELVKDLVKVPLHELAKHFDELQEAVFKR